jgi:pyridinium-3,5-bisthiocarboxylic acid mononucleotide nickel chelatase
MGGHFAQEDRVGRHLHFDCFSGVSGDMVLGALVDAGLPWAALVEGLKRLKLKGYRLRQRDVHRGALHAVKVDVLIERGFHRPLTLDRIRRLLRDSVLPEPVKERSRAVFERLAQAEGLAHRVAVKDVHFHEVGVIDSFIDVVGGILGCHLLHVTRVTASAINVGSGTIQTAHGLLPVPGPAVAALATGIPIYAEGPRCELATPTGVALLRTLTSEFGSRAEIEVGRIGYGAGDRDPDGWPNVLRVFLSDERSGSARARDRVTQIETNLDDLNPQAYEHLMDRLFAVGALDVALIPVIMKRSRPGIVLSCLAAPDRTDAVLEILFQETTALGARIQEVARQVLPRRFARVQVQGRPVRMKIAELGAGWEKAAPEYADCKKIASDTGRPLKQVMEEAALAFRESKKAKVKSKKYRS